jgi:2-polyprenyl-3-methyl-5-hydroxy-6-metoxy-1,4-benzoquinol methylase
MVAAFDVVISFGLIEHFEDTDACLKAISQFIAPQGLLITFIPNMEGFPGFYKNCLTNKFTVYTSF